MTTPTRNSCGCAYTSYVIGEYGAGGGPWCPSCGRRLPDRLPPMPGSVAADLAELGRRAAALRAELMRPFLKVWEWMPRHQVLTALLVLAWTALLCWTIWETR